MTQKLTQSLYAVALAVAIALLYSFGLNNQCLCAIDDDCRNVTATTENAKRISLSLPQNADKSDCCEICFQQSDGGNSESIAVDFGERQAEKLVAYADIQAIQARQNVANLYLRSPPPSTTSGRETCLRNCTFLI